MTDSQNVGTYGETPHGIAASFKTKALAVANAEDEAGFTDYAVLYKRGLDVFRGAGFHFERSAAGSHCGHKVYVESSPKAVAGVTYPSWFKYRRLIESAEDEAFLTAAMLKGGKADVEVQQFWSPVTQPMSGTKASPLQGYVERLTMLDAAHLAQHESEPIELGIQFDNFSRATSSQDEYPRAYVPAADWFDESIQRLTFRDIFTLWPAAELEMLQLVLGRAMAGRSGSRPVGSDKVLEHTYRSVGIVIGEDAGLGKSTIFEKLFKALNLVGYVRTNFRDVGERFGIGAVAESDIAYKDDVTGKTLASLVASENTKIIASGGLITCEDKFAKASSIASRTVLLANTNEWNPRLVYSLDAGTVDRIKLLTTYRRAELDRAGRAECGSVASQSESFAPFIHIAWLANELSVSQEALLLWAMRLAVDEFTKLCFWRGDVPTEALRLRVHDLSSRLRYSFNKDTTRALACAMLFSNVLLRHLNTKSMSREQYPWRELNQTVLTESFEDFRRFASDKGFYRVRSLLKQHWEQNGRSETHPWAGIRKLNFHSIRAASSKLSEATQNRLPLAELVKSTFSELTLRDGFTGSSDIVWVTSAWQACYGYLEDIEALARVLYALIEDNSMSDEPLSDAWAALSASSTVDDSWISESHYTPTGVDKQLKQLDAGGLIASFSDNLLAVQWHS